ncbi:hypothetical protein D3C86_1740100 [compost metagenome]
MAANTVVEQVDRHALRGFLQKQRLQASAQMVVMNDEELNQYRFACVTDGLEDRLEGGLAIDQQAQLIVGQARHASQLGHRPQ